MFNRCCEGLKNAAMGFGGVIVFAAGAVVTVAGGAGIVAGFGGFNEQIGIEPGIGPIIGGAGALGLGPNIALFGAAMIATACSPGVADQQNYLQIQDQGGPQPPV